MIRVNIRVAGARGPLTVRAESIRQALNIADGFFPGGEPKVVFPIEPEGFFAEGGAPGLVGSLAEPLEQAV